MKNKSKTLLVCGNWLSGEIIPEIKRWGYNICLLSEFPFDKNVDCVDHYENVNTLDVDASLDAAKRISYEGWKFDGIISLCWDCPISVSTIAEYFGLKAISVEVAKRSTYKNDRIKCLLNADGINVPKFFLINNGHSEIDKNISHKHKLAYPLVSKPVDLASSLGVYLIKSPEEFDFMVEKTKMSLAISKRKEILIEEYIDGIEYSAEGLMVGESFYMTGLSERIFDSISEPNFSEIGDIIPTTLSLSERNHIHDTCEKAAIALGINQGVIKYDLKISSSNKLYIFEHCCPINFQVNCSWVCS